MTPEPPRINARKFFLTIILPTLLTVGLFIGMIFLFLIPYFEQNLLAQKKGMIRELVNAAVSSAEEFAGQAAAGRMSAADARRQAVRQITAIRYGVENKDYFWITDLHPRMIAHPYRPDLNGHDLNGFTDPEGKELFVEMVRVVRAQGAGYVDYRWQWMDEAGRIVPKISYVRQFAPWGWIVGTGIYIEDIRLEIASIKRRLLGGSLLISLLLALLLTFIVRQNLKAEIKRSEAEADLLHSREKYKALVEASTEGTWMLLGGRTIFTNQKLEGLFPGLAQQPLSEDLHEILPASRGADRQRLAEFCRGPESFLQLETQVAGGDGRKIDVLLSVSKVVLSEKKGYIIVLKELRPEPTPERGGAEETLCAGLADDLRMGYFRASVGKRGRLLDCNAAALRLLGFADADEALRVSLFDLVPERREWKALLRRLEEEGCVLRFPLRLRTRSGTIREVLLSARLNRDAQGKAVSSEGLLEEVDEIRQRQRLGEMVRADLSSLLLHFSRPSGQAAREAVFCPADLPVGEAAALMNLRQADALVVRSAAAAAIGIVTDADLRRRVVAAGVPAGIPVSAVMSSPLHGVGADTPVGESLGLMERLRIGHLVVRSAAGEVCGLLRRGDIERQIRIAGAGEPAGPQAAASRGDLREDFDRLPHLVELLVSGGARTELITGLTTQTADAIARALAASIEAELGPPPVPYALLVLGSEGRSEQTLITDQDNALLFADSQSVPAERSRSYFLEFGSRLNRLLALSGYALCRGEVMAGNPSWNQPLAAWKRYFSEWIHTPDAQNLLEISTFFDLRRVWGDPGLVAALETHVQETLRSTPAFFGHLARVCLAYKIPLGLFGKIQTEADAETALRLNIKNPIRVIVNLVRLYAMAHGIRATNTLERVRGLAAQGVFPRPLQRDIRFAFDFLMIRQFQAQLQAYRQARPLDHFLDLGSISTIERETLKAVFSQIGDFQARLKHDFSLAE